MENNSRRLEDGKYDYGWNDDDDVLYWIWD